MILTQGFDAFVTVDLVRLVAFLLGFLLMGGLARLSWNAYRTRAETDASNKVLAGIAVYSLSNMGLIFVSLSHVTDKVHRASVPWISATLIVTLLFMALGLFLVLRGQAERVIEARNPYSGNDRRRMRLTLEEEHPLDQMTDEAVNKDGDDLPPPR